MALTGVYIGFVGCRVGDLCPDGFGRADFVFVAAGFESRRFVALESVGYCLVLCAVPGCSSGSCVLNGVEFRRGVLGNRTFGDLVCGFGIWV